MTSAAEADLPFLVHRHPTPAAIALLGLLAAVACGPEPTTVDTDVVAGPIAPISLPAVPVWPTHGAQLDPQPIVHRAALQGVVVAIDAGHGTGRNFGANSCRCIDEQDVVLPIAEAAAEALEQAGLEVIRLRRPGRWPSYGRRLQQLEQSGAVAMISVHADARLPAEPWMPNLDCEALISEDQPGFSVLWSDEHPDRIEARHGLARAVAARLQGAGLPPYDGRDYVGAYEQTEVGVFVDRHAPRQRIRFLRAPAVPSVIAEVGHLLDPDESERLLEPKTIQSLGHALAGGMIDFLAEEQSP